MKYFKKVLTVVGVIVLLLTLFPTTVLAVIPDPPTNFDAVPGNTEIDLSWTKDGDADSTYIRYLVGITPPSTITEGTLVCNSTGTSYTHESLVNGTTYAYSAWSLAVGGNSTNYVSVIATCGAPDIQTDSATDVEANSASLNGRVVSVGGTSTVAVHIYWGDNDGGESSTAWDNDINIGDLDVGSFSEAISGLDAGETYYYICYASNTHGEDWGDTEIFTTSTGLTPLVETLVATNIEENCATLRAQLNNDGGEPCAVWIEYWPQDCSDIDCYQRTEYGVGYAGYTISKTICNLEPNQVYYYKAAAYNSHGTAYGATRLLVTGEYGNPYLLAIEDVRAFKSVVYENDQLYYVRFNLKYAYEPIYHPGEIFSLDMWEGVVKIAEDNLEFYGQGVAAFYFLPANAPDWGSSFEMKISADAVYLDPEEGINWDSYTMESYDFETNSAEFCPYLRGQVEMIERARGETFLDYSQKPSAFTGSGVIFLNTALSGLGDYCPNSDPSFVDTDYEHVYAGTLADRWDDTEYGEALNTFGGYVGLSRMWFTSVLWVLLSLVVTGLIVRITKRPEPVLILLVPMIVGGALLGFLPLVVPALCAFAGIMAIGYVFFYKVVA